MHILFAIYGHHSKNHHDISICSRWIHPKQFHLQLSSSIQIETVKTNFEPYLRLWFLTFLSFHLLLKEITKNTISSSLKKTHSTWKTASVFVLVFISSKSSEALIQILNEERI